MDHCNEAQLELDSALAELQSQHDAARASIDESYQSYKAVVERCRDNALKQLDLLHADRELKVMEVMHDVEKCTEKIECVGRFTERVLAACNGPELLSLKSTIARQFGHVVQHMPRTSVHYSIEFESQFETFQQLAQDTYGKFHTEMTAHSPKESTPPPTLPGMPPSLMMNHNNNNSNNHGHLARHQQQQQQQLSMGHQSQNQIHHHQSQQQHNGLQYERHQQQHQQQQQNNQHNNYLQLQAMNNKMGGNTRPLMGANGGGLSTSSSLNLMGISAFNGTATSQNGGALTNSLTASSPISLAASMQSSFDGDMSGSQAPSSASTTGSMPPSFNNGPVSMPPMNVPPPSLVGSSGVNNGVGNVNNNNPLPNNSSNGLTSIAEYNIQQLANLVEQSSSSSVTGAVVSIPSGADVTDSILPASVSVPPPNNAQTAITLNDILSIDPHALQAWSKMGGLNQQASALLSRGPSPGVDNLLLNDYSAIAPNSDDLMLANFNAAAVAGAVGGSSASANGGGIGGQAQAGVGVPGRTKSTAMQIRCKFGSLGPSKGQFNSPHGFCLGVDEEIVVADTNNHRIEVFEKSGTFKFQFGVPGKDEGQLWYPRKVAVMRPSSKFVVCDRGNERSRMQIFNKAGHFMKKIAIR